MANSSDKRDGSGSSEWEEDRSETSKTKDRSGRRTETRAHDEDDGKDKEKNFHVSRKTLTIGGVCVGVVLICVFLYWLHARNFESTDDAYTTTHVHEISARVAGTVKTVNVDDNQLVKAGHPLVVLDQRDFKVALEQARAQQLQRRATTAQAQANLDHAQSDYDRITKLSHEKVVSKQDLDNATAALRTGQGDMDAATADLATAEAALHNAELQLSYTTVVAPADRPPSSVHKLFSKPQLFAYRVGAGSARLDQGGFSLLSRCSETPPLD
jgi:multidrug resistance efflux pump